MQDEDWETPEDIRDLRRPEHLLVWTLRAIAVGHADCPAVRQAFASACGDAGDQARMGFFLLVRQIGMAGRRRLRLHMPGCVCLSADERAIVAVVAAAQDALRTGQDERLRAHLRWLVEGEPPQTFLNVARSVAEALQATGHRLPLRMIAPPVAVQTFTVH
jgi:hypothetical protein